jgi:MinD-like ATPase involved in chromosome partitioning or flagellar assembly
VRPVEQNRDFRADGHEREVRALAPAAVRSGRRAQQPEQAETDLDRKIHAAVGRTGTIAVMSCAGGVGKSTLSLAIADILARAGHGPVALVDCDAELAGLSVLAPEGGEMSQLISDPDTPPEQHAATLPSGVDLYATGHHAPMLALMMDRPDILRRIAIRLRQQYPLVILDAGAGLQNTVGRTLAETCDVAVLVSRATIATTAGFLYSYRYLRNARALVDSEKQQAQATAVLAVINNIRDHQHADLEILKEEFLEAGLAPLLIPANETIENALEHGEYNMDQIPAHARVALKQLALSVLQAHP